MRSTVSTYSNQVSQFDHYARLVRRLLDVPVGLVSLIEPDRQRFVGAVGLPEPEQESRQTPLSHSFCQYVVKDAQPLIVSDARLDRRLQDNGAIEDLGVVAYAGWPVSDHTGRVIGSLCAIDTRPREWTRVEIETLEDLATACSAELSQRERADDVTTALTSAEEVGEQTRALLALSTALAGTETLADVAAAVVRISTRELGCARGGLWLRDTDAAAHDEPVGTELLSLAADPGSSWSSAMLFPELPLGRTNPLGAALLGRQMIWFEARTTQDATYPHLAELDRAGEARAFLPLQLGGRAYGTLALVWPGRRRFTDQDRVSMAALASYTAQAVHRAQLLQGRAAAAVTLQRAMLTSIPASDHLTIAARYQPAGASEKVGGDWYDAVVAPSGATYLTIGDVIGHDLEAAAVMGQLRSMLRMTSWLSATTATGTPARDLEFLDRAMHDLGLETLATAVLARVEQTADDARDQVRRLRWANAGHLPPVLAGPDGTVRLLHSDGRNGLMLGVTPDTERRDNTTEVETGSTLLLYTDGLVERRGEILDLGLQRLTESVARHASCATEEFLDGVLGELVDEHHEDDVAVLAVRFGPQ